MTHTIHRSEVVAPDNGAMKSDPLWSAQNLGDALASLIALGITLLGVLAAALLVGWAMLEVAGWLGLLTKPAVGWLRLLS